MSKKQLVYPFSYYGGKVTLFPWIASNLPPAHAFVDLFGGSGVVALNLVYDYKRVVYNDLDWRMSNFFWALREFPDELIHKIRLTPTSRSEFDASYEESDDPIEQARRTFVKITQAFGKIGCRKQKSGWLLPCKQGNRTSSILSRVENLEEVVERLRLIEIEQKPALDLIKKESREDSLLFADPPYVHGSRNGIQAYYHEMKDEDHVDMCNAFNECKSNVVLCGYENDIYNDLLKDWRLVKKETISTTAASKSQRSNRALERTECLWIKR